MVRTQLERLRELTCENFHTRSKQHVFLFANARFRAMVRTQLERLSELTCELTLTFHAEFAMLLTGALQLMDERRSEEA